MTITAIEDLIIAAITDALPYLAAVETYKGQLDRDVRELVFRPGTVLVSLTKTEQTRGAYDSYGMTHQFDIIVLCRNLRGEGEGRRDADTGAYRILDDLRQALNGVTLDNDLLPLKFLQEESILITRELVAYVASYELSQEVVYG